MGGGWGKRKLGILKWELRLWEIRGRTRRLSQRTLRTVVGSSVSDVFMRHSKLRRYLYDVVYTIRVRDADLFRLASHLFLSNFYQLLLQCCFGSTVFYELRYGLIWFFRVVRTLAFFLRHPQFFAFNFALDSSVLSSFAVVTVRNSFFILLNSNTLAVNIYVSSLCIYVSFLF